LSCALQRLTVFGVMEVYSKLPVGFTIICQTQGVGLHKALTVCRSCFSSTAIQVSITRGVWQNQVSWSCFYVIEGTLSRSALEDLREVGNQSVVIFDWPEKKCIGERERENKSVDQRSCNFQRHIGTTRTIGRVILKT